MRADTDHIIFRRTAIHEVHINNYEENQLPIIWLRAHQISVPHSKCADIAHLTDVGFNEQHFDSLVIAPGEHVNFGCGFNIEIPSGMALYLFNRADAGLSCMLQHGLLFPDDLSAIAETGSIGFTMINLTPHSIVVNEGDPIIGAMVVKIQTLPVVVDNSCGVAQTESSSLLSQDWSGVKIVEAAPKKDEDPT